MNSVRGMLVEEVRRMARDLDAAAEEIGQMTTDLTIGLEQAAWTGPDADRFRAEWTDEMVPALEDLAATVSALSTIAQTDAQEQQTASA